MTHHEGTCAECMATTRADLHEIARMCDALPEEVEHRGVEGEAMVLLGPSADWEARNHHEASVLAGRVSPDYLADARDERHPRFVLDGWDSVWRDALDHDEAGDRELATFVDYLDRTMGYMSGYPHVPFEDFARDLRRCVAHLEAVLHDGEQVEMSGVGCIEDGCHARLVKTYACNQDHDGWRCGRDACSSRYDHARYMRALHQQLTSEGAEKWIRVAEALSVVPRPEQTLRTWIITDAIRHRRDEATGQVYVWWPDVRMKHVESQTRSRRKAVGE